jgi:hypothetical protein
VTDDIDDADHDPANELQTLTIVGNSLSISNGNSITLPSGGSTFWQSFANGIYYDQGEALVGDASTGLGMRLTNSLLELKNSTPSIKMRNANGDLKIEMSVFSDSPYVDLLGSTQDACLSLKSDLAGERGILETYKNGNLRTEISSSLANDAGTIYTYNIYVWTR